MRRCCRTAAALLLCGLTYNQPPHAEVIAASNAVVDFDWVLAPRPLTADEEPPAAAAATAAGSTEEDAVCKPCGPGGPAA